MMNLLILLGCTLWSVSAVNWQSADSGQIRWSTNCDIRGTDIGNQKTSGELCGAACLSRPDCSTFTWTDWEGGTCWLKGSGGQVVDTNSGVCGQIMSRKSNANVNWVSVDGGRIRWASNCNFHGADIGNQKTSGEQCGSACLQRQDCTRFVWTDWEGGTCWLKNGNADPVAANSGVCGQILDRTGGGPAQPTGEFNRDYVGLAFSPYTKQWEANRLPLWNSYPIEDIKTQLNVVNRKFQFIATYGMGVAQYNRDNNWDQTDANCLVARAAAQINREKNQRAIRVAQGVNQQGDQGLQQKEIDNAFAAAQDANGIYGGTVWGLVFTNEYFTNDESGNKILAMIGQNKQRARQLGLKVGTRINVCGLIHQGGSKRDILANIVRQSDYIMCNLYPTNNVVNNGIDNAVQAVANAYMGYVAKFKEINPNIDVMIGETGWPSEGKSFNNSPNNVQNLRQYWARMADWANKNRVLVHMFEAIDEPWKSNKNSQDVNSPSGPNGAEGHYGWWTRVGNEYREKS